MLDDIRFMLSHIIGQRIVKAWTEPIESHEDCEMLGCNFSCEVAGPVSDTGSRFFQIKLLPDGQTPMIMTGRTGIPGELLPARRIELPQASGRTIVRAWIVVFADAPRKPTGIGLQLDNGEELNCIPNVEGFCQVVDSLENDLFPCAVAKIETTRAEP